MLDFSKLIQETFNEIEFIEDTHTYLVKGNEFISTTTFLKEFIPKFNTEKISKLVSKKTGITQEEIKQDWKEKGDNGREIGTALHKHIENEICGFAYEKPLVQDSNLELLNKKILQFEEFKKDHLQDKILVGSELIIYDEEYKLAGTIDCLLYDTKNNCFWYIDWKSNKNISTQNKWSNLLPPLQRYENTNLNIYALQLSIYRYIVEKNVLSKFKECENIISNSLNVIVSFPEEGSYKIYYTPYLKLSVQSILNIRMKNF